MTCKKCGKEILDSSKFCTECGAKVEQKATCPKCGAEIASDDVFCGECGSKIEAEKLLCAGCGAEVPPGKRFCSKCGTKVGERSTREKKDKMPTKPTYTEISANYKEMVSDFEPAYDKTDSFLMPIEKAFFKSGKGTVVIGKIKSGVVNVNDTLEIVGITWPRKVIVSEIQISHLSVKNAKAGIEVGILLHGVDVKSIFHGQVLATPDMEKSCEAFTAKFYVLTKEEDGRHSPFFTGFKPQFYFNNAKITGTVTLAHGVDMVKPGDSVEVKIEPIYSIVVKEGWKLEMRESKQIIGLGKITSVEECATKYSGNFKRLVSKKNGAKAIETRTTVKPQYESKETPRELKESLSLLEKLKNIISKKLEIDKSIVTLDSFLSDFGVDSLDAYELIYDAEEKFGVEIPDEDALKFKTVRDVFEYILSKSLLNNL